MEAGSELHAPLFGAFRRRVDACIAQQLQREEGRAETLRGAVLQAVREGVAQARRQGCRARIWVFGSFAWGRPAVRSDVDLLVETQSEVERVAQAVAAHCSRPLHVLAADRADRTLMARVMTEGVEL